MKKIIAIILSAMLCISLATPVFADTRQNEKSVPQITSIDAEGNKKVQPMRCYTVDELKKELPREVLETINTVQSEPDVTPYGLSPPSQSNKWDLDTSEYHFTVDMNNGNVYSNYVFTGHTNGVCLTTYDISGNDGFFVGTVMVIRDDKTVWGGNGNLARGTESSVLVDNLEPTDLLYFYISVNDRVQTELDWNGSYFATDYINK